MALAKRTIEKALALDPDLPQAQTVAGSIETHGSWDFERAEAHFERALELDPALVMGHQQLGTMLAYTGRLEEATRHMEIAKDLDPLTSDPAGVDLGRLYALRGDTEKAIAYWKEISELDPYYAQPIVSHAEHLCASGEAALAIELLDRAVDLVPEDPWFLANRGHCYAISGRAEKARADLAALATQASSEYVSPVGPALVHIGLGENEEAVAALERAYELRSIRLLSLILDPRWEPLHQDPRYLDLVLGVGLIPRVE
jgi:tetratricopeptide (TPR) repeat protein